MLAFLQSIWHGILGVGGILLPMAQGGWQSRIPAGLRWFLHVLLLVLVLSGLAFLNYVLGIWDLIPRPTWAKHIWLPMLFLLIYALAWTIWWIWVLLVSDAGSTPFPDIDEAWAEATAALDHAGISLHDVPLFLVLGRPEAPQDSLFQAAGLELVVRQVPGSGRAPLHVFANHEGIYLTCAGASLMGKHASNLALEGLIDAVDDGPAAEEAGFDDAKTLKPKRQEQQAMATLAMAAEEGMKALQKRQVRRLLNKRNPELLYNSAEVERLTARLAHLCRLVVRDRQPDCPINGILLLVPLGGTDTDADAQQTAELCYRDLHTVRRLMKLRCPIFALVCDLESFPGFRDFIRRKSVQERRARVGQRFPLASPDHEGDVLLRNIEVSVRWLSQKVMRDQIYQMFQVSKDTNDEVAQNKNYFLFLDQMHQRGERLARILMNGLRTDARGPLLFGGCYLAGTGADKDTEQAFVGGVIKRLLDCQGFVSWTDHAIDEDQSSQRITQIGYTLMGLAALVVAGLGWWAYIRRR